MNKIRSGVLFCLDGKYFADYAPWIEFGDDSVEKIIQDFRSGKSSLFTKKIIDLLSLDRDRLHCKHQSFLNHNFKDLGSKLIVKIKLSSNIDESIAIFRSHNTYEKLRIDFNNLLNINELTKFLAGLSDEERARIDYVEDPFSDVSNWEEFKKYGIDFACDRNKENKQYIKIYKPNIETKPILSKRVIFSSYMGHELGMYHAYLKLMQEGDLAEYHGIVTEEIFIDQLALFDYENKKFHVNELVLEELYVHLRGLDWKVL